eukprot:TRINITY_DN6155_c0_g1_i1.p1 TRINITY_DN6155_c0_g1~~TRINITY_DN6155_c0_g1_i1.p1  ORF type:complete len:597 (-),score=116.29 TRINITY_DN6155_c0_g1_i1:481-2226(-)
METIKISDVPMMTRDGFILYADLHCPQQVCDGETYPVMLIRTPYGKDFKIPGYGNIITEIDFFPEKGFVVAVQDTRGRYKSQGKYSPFQEENDGYDAVMWASELPQSDGRVVCVGQSYMGHTQIALATQAPEPLVAICPVSPIYHLEDCCLFRDGVFEFEWIFKYFAYMAQDTIRKSQQDDKVYPHREWTSIPLRWRIFRKFASWFNQDLDGGITAMFPFDDEVVYTYPIMDLADEFEGYGAGSHLRKLIESMDNREYWLNYYTSQPLENINVPCFLVSSWYDAFLIDTIKIWESLQDHTPELNHKLWIGPWGHLLPYSKPTDKGAGPEVVFGENAKIQLHEEQLKFLRSVLDENEEDEIPPIYSFIIGTDEWVETDNNNLEPEVYQKLYIDNKQLLNREPNQEGIIRFKYDPEDPCPSIGGTVVGPNMGIRDQSINHDREDVVIIESETLEEEITILGKLYVELYINSNVINTDFTCKINEKLDDGTCYNVVEGITRVNDIEEEPILIYVDLWATGWTFHTGSQIQLEISSSNFPRYDRNLNNGESSLYSTLEPVVAHQEIYYGEKYPSKILLPVLLEEI